MRMFPVFAAITSLAFANIASTAKAANVPTLVHHDIYITLKDTSQASVDRQLEIGRKYLNGHPGELSFSATVLAKGLTRHQQVAYLHNDTDFQVAFHLIFKDAKSHDEYQTSEMHVKYFIPMSKENWKELRVFDTAD